MKNKAGIQTHRTSSQWLTRAIATSLRVIASVWMEMKSHRAFSIMTFARPCIVPRIFSQIRISFQARSRKSRSTFTQPPSLDHEAIRAAEEVAGYQYSPFFAHSSTAYQVAKALCQ